MPDVIVIDDTQLFDPYMIAYRMQTTSEGSSSERTARSSGGKRVVQRVFLQCIDEYKANCVYTEDCVLENGAFKFLEHYCLRCGSELILKTTYTEHDDADDATDVDSEASQL